MVRNVGKPGDVGGWIAAALSLALLLIVALLLPLQWFAQRFKRRTAA